MSAGGEKSGRITCFDVARRAGVSRAAVSRSFKPDASVSAKAREEVSCRSPLDPAEQRQSGAQSFPDGVVNTAIRECLQDLVRNSTFGAGSMAQSSSVPYGCKVRCE